MFSRKSLQDDSYKIADKNIVLSHFLEIAKGPKICFYPIIENVKIVNYENLSTMILC